MIIDRMCWLLMGRDLREPLTRTNLITGQALWPRGRRIFETTSGVEKYHFVSRRNYISIDQFL
jgi:hypothetical protein